MNTYLLISGSNHYLSNNKKAFKLLEAKFNCSSWILPEDQTIPFVQDRVTLPDNIPLPIRELYSLVKSLNKIIFIAPEHNSCFSAYFKNIIDWLSMLDRYFLANKNIILISASNTTKDKRGLEDIAHIVFTVLGCKDYHFINWNNFSNSTDSDIDLIYKKIENIFNHIDERG